MKKKKYFFIRLFTLISFVNFFVNSQPAFADIAVPDRPNPPRLVNDFAHLLSDDQVAQLEQKLDRYNDSTSTQIVIVIINSLNDADPATYAYSIGDKWGAGSKKFDNGIVLLVSKNDHQVFIATGKGMEGPLPDVTCNNIIQNIILPNFRNNDYYTGIDQATDAMIKVIGGEFVNDVSNSGRKPSPPWPLIIFIIIFILAIISRIGRGGRGMISRGGFIGPLLWGSMLGGGRGFGGGGFGGGGGGFGGFGGGSFGGGGAGGHW